MSRSSKKKMEKVFEKLDDEDMKVLIKFLKRMDVSTSRVTPVAYQQPLKLDPIPMDMKLDGPATYLSWSQWITGALAGRGLEGYLTGEEEEPGKNTDEWKIWRTTHMSLYTWLLDSMIRSIVVTVDGIQSVRDIWVKLQRTYAGAENNMRVFQIGQEIDAVLQGDRTVQEYVMELERIWTDYDHFSPMTACKDPECKMLQFVAQKRTMQFLSILIRHLTIGEQFS